MKSLRRRLFGSHLLVMAVALAVMIVGLGVAFAAVEVAGDPKGSFDGNDRDGPGPLGLVVPLGAAAIAAGLVSWRVSRRIATPLERIGDATRELARGRYEVRADGGDIAELVELAGDVNRLASELDQTERRRLQLIGDVAHELRNPLATIEASMEALMDGVVAPTDETYARIGSEAARLRRLAGDLSELSAAGELARGNARVRVRLDVVVASVVEQLTPQAAAKSIDLRLETAGPVEVVGDADRLAQVATNVIGNAIQYTDAGTVDVMVEVAETSTTLRVVDSGRGLDRDDLERVFERFYRVDEQYTDGTGVGLAVARAIVEAHHGSIRALSAGLGRGTEFVITLPRDQPAR